jgi:DNA-binding beta-propeller fold protein YncE
LIFHLLSQQVILSDLLPWHDLAFVALGFFRLSIFTLFLNSEQGCVQSIDERPVSSQADRSQSSSSSSVRLLVSLSNGSWQSIDLPPKSSVTDLKRRIQAQFAIRPSHQRVLLPRPSGGLTQLDDDRSLHACGVVSGSDLRIEIIDQVPGDYIGDIGVSGGGGMGGQMYSPFSLCLTDDNRLLVADADNHQIQVFRVSDFAHINSFGDCGAALGQFQFPRGLCVYKNEIFVVDTFNHRIQVLNSTDGTPLRVFGSEGNADGQFMHPRRVFVHPQTGHLFVTDTGNHRIQVFNVSDNQFLYSIGSNGSGQCQFNFPSAAVVGPNGELYVSDQGNRRIQVFKDRLFVRSFGSGGSGPGQMKTPEGLYVGPDGLLYVADWENQRIMVLRAEDGEQLRLIGSRNESQGRFAYPHDLCISSHGEMYVADYTHHRVLVFLA